MRTKIVIAVGALALLTTGCGSNSGSDDTTSKPKPPVLPQKLVKPGEWNYEPAPGTSPASDASFADNVAFELQRKTLQMANAPGKTTGECPKDLGSKSGTKVTCTTTYEGVKLVWDVTIGEKTGWSENVVEYQAFPRDGLLAREGVARILFGNNSGLDYALCNNIPKAVLVPFGKTKYQCEEVLQGRQPTGYNQTVHVTNTGPMVH
ncbi:hypothetical protein [Streptomyces sp. NPDC000229]|uniref:hypothetical protein n=1 Tax=Streptomyces sp. NPDC000229 TaxID=3154247 RepID=UPI0033206858